MLDVHAKALALETCSTLGSHHCVPHVALLLPFVQKAGKLFGIFAAKDKYERPVLLFRNEWKLANVQAELPQLDLVPWSRPPDLN